jgi:TonB family protein
MAVLWKLVALVTLFSALVWAQAGSTPAPPSNSNPPAAQSSPSGEKPTTGKTTPELSATQPSIPDSTKLEPIKIQKADYPWEAREKQLQGQVVVKILVSETGDVASVELISGDPILAKSALDAAKKWKFKPFIRNGKPIQVSTNVPFDFAFSDKVKDEKIPPVDEAAPASVPSEAVPAGADAPKVATPQRVRVSQGVSQGLLLHKVQPVYPPEARQAGIQGKVLLRARISKEGRIVDLQLISGPKELAQAAIGAVQQWRYRPYLLMGNPVEVDTEIVVNFTLSYR